MSVASSRSDSFTIISFMVKLLEIWFSFVLIRNIEKVFFGLEILVLTDMIKIYIDIRYK